MDNEELNTRYWNVKFRARERQFYYAGRLRFWEWFAKSTLLCDFALSTAVAGMLLSKAPPIASVIATSIVAVCSFLTILLEATTRIRECDNLYRCYVRLEGDANVDTDRQTQDGARRIERKMQELIGMDSREMPCWEAICHRDACIALGVSPQWRLNWFERWFGRWLPIPYTPKAELEVARVEYQRDIAD